MSASSVLKAIAILMLLLAPLRIAAGGAVAASLHDFELTISLGHCEGESKSQNGQPRSHGHCSMAVPGAPVGSDAVGPPPEVKSRVEPLVTDAIAEGLGPEATTPPPRIF